MLAKRQHQAIAEAIKEEMFTLVDYYQAGLAGDDSFNHVQERLASLVRGLCRYFAWDSPKFDQQAFIEATGIDLEGDHELV